MPPAQLHVVHAVARIRPPHAPPGATAGAYAKTVWYRDVVAKRAAEISCVIPTHGRPELLSEAIASVLRQRTHRHFELIVSDDIGSASTRSVVLAAKQNSTIRVHYLSCPGTGGASGSRNFGASAAEGEFLAFLDDDDFWDENFLQRTIDSIESAGSDMAVTWLNALHLDGSIKPVFKILNDVTPADAAAWNVGITGSNFMIRKSAFEAMGGFDSDLKVSNDKDFFVRFLLTGLKYSVVPEFLACQRRHDGPQLTDVNEQRLAGMEMYLRKHRSVLTKKDRRSIRRRIHKGRFQLAKGARARVQHTFGFLTNLSIEDIAGKWHSKVDSKPGRGISR